jgi:geranylgeranyl reductase family protein
MEKYDVIIVGAGPAGACAAYTLAKSKINVLVIDKDYFPRYKPCAGGLTAKTLNSLDFPITENIKYVTNSIVASYKDQVFHKLSGNKVLTEMVERAEFDHFFIKKAVDSGAIFLDGIKVTGIIWESGIFNVKTEERLFCCHYLIGADGVNSIVNRTFGIVEKDFCGFGITTDCPVSKEKIGSFDMSFDFGTVPNGYLWTFPKDQHVCVGAYTTNKKMKDIQKYLLDYIERHGLVSESEKIKGHIVPFYGINYKQPDFPCILVGDAAGFGDYWTGEGIYYAVKSGAIAAEVVHSSINSGLFDYELIQKRYEREIIRSLKLAYYFGDIFYSHLPLAFNIVMSFFPLSILYEYISRGFTYDQLLSKFHVVLLSLILNKSKISSKKYYNKIQYNEIVI